MRGEWPIVPIEEICEKIAMGPFGSSIKVETFLDAGIPVISGQHLRESRLHDGDFKYISVAHAEKLANANVQRGDVVFTHAGNIGQVAYIPPNSRYERYVISQRQFYVRPITSKVIPEYLAYYFESPAGRHQLLANASSSGVPSIAQPVSYLRKIRIPVPSVAEQCAIAHILGTLDDKIELNRRMNETLEAIARALFKSWFVDFDPVRAKSESRDPGLPAHLADLFPDSFEDSELGGIPRGWRVGSVYEIADVVYGAPFASALFNTESAGEPLLRIRDLATESPGVWTTEPLDRGYRVQPGDIVVGMDGEFRAYVWGGTPAWLNQRLCAFRPNEGYSAAFVRGAITALLAEVEATETATTVIHLGKGDIDDFRVVVPPLRVVEAFSAVGRPAYDRLVLAKQEGRTLAAMRDALLPRLLSGDVPRVAVPSVADA